jgi:hypothetical protein
MAFDLVAEVRPGEAIEPWAAAGATWVLTGFESSPRQTEVRTTIEAGPG